jgi:hypothetical protein
VDHQTAAYEVALEGKCMIHKALNVDLSHTTLHERDNIDANKGVDRSGLFIVYEYHVLGVGSVSKPEG